MNCQSCNAQFNSDSTECPSCGYAWGECRVVNDCECGKPADSTCPKCSCQCCVDCRVKSDWGYCHACTVQIMNEESLAEKQSRIGEELGESMFNLCATLMRAQDFTSRMDVVSQRAIG